MPAAKKTATPNYQALENRLVLASWFYTELGFDSNKAMLEDLTQAQEGFDASGRSFLANRLASRARCELSAEDLDRYDANIQAYLRHINQHRTQPLVLRYFQHLSLLATEVFLDRLSSTPKQLLADLNNFVHESNTKNPVNPFPEFVTADLQKLAFWMATGSGKTILFHVHYLQFLHYRPCEVDNILLITPNANLTNQHLAEMAESNIPCERFQIDQNRSNRVRVVEITKLVEEKKGGGESVAVSEFEGKNLVFVDEGHKGTGSDAEAFRRRRQALASDGFTFEYSATFGQALDASKKDEVTIEYAKAILFDYSYRYFYGDGFGKSFHILNLKETKDEEAVDTLMLANLLSFFEQKLYFADHREAVREYGLETPLWLLIGSQVTSTRSDTLRVVRFLARFLSNTRGWSEKTIRKIIEGKSGIYTTENQDLFDGHLNYLRSEWSSSPDKAALKTIFHQILKLVFNADVAGEMEILSIGNSKGEIGLRVSGCDNYFGLIYIGDAPKFRKAVEEGASNLRTGDDAIVSPLFPTVKQPDSPINLLIGAKKFMEGWSSWRVSNMGLLNVGRSEGSEIIQLFGRGVRLRGWGRLLKRSEALPDMTHPPHLPLLETLNIFAIRADYMSNFKSYLEREGVPTDGYETFDLSLLHNEDFLKEGLVRPRLPEGKRFADEEDLILSVEPTIQVKVDMTTRVRALHGGDGVVEQVNASGGSSRKISNAALHHINWDQIHLTLINYKESRSYHNLAIPHSAPRAIMADEGPVYELIAPDSWMEPGSNGDVSCLQESVLSILKKYIDRQYRNAQKRWESHNMVVDEITKTDKNLKDNYRISIPRCAPEMVKMVSEIVEEAKKAVSTKKPAKVHEEELELFPNLIFDQHLYQPLLTIARGKVEIKGGDVLNESETTFVKDLRDFWKVEKGGILKGKQVYLLRNLGRGKGIGFFEDHGFYPDFILWMKETKTKKQRVIFVEPHGMLLGSDGPMGDKLRLHETLGEHIAPSLKKAKMSNVSLDAFVVSSTPFAKLRKKFKAFDGNDWPREKFLEHHVLFQDLRSSDYDYVKALCEW